MDGDALPHEIIRCGMQREQPSPCTMPVQYNAMPVQCNAMVAQAEDKTLHNIVTPRELGTEEPVELVEPVEPG